ncbi:MAG TPA: TonB-dependent siderophore receptor, partial [Arenimonas sp.]|nr:TonB-dependent siderophore receptor [Arenimonas sp.]
ETELKDLPQSVSVVTEQQIQDLALHGMADVLRYVPGATMAQGEGHRDAPVLRGNVSTGDFYTDGIRDDIQYYRDLYNVSQVEALKGPNAMIFGRGGSGGVINRVTKQANGNTVKALNLQAGSDSFYRAQADFGDAITDNVAYRVNALFENAGSFRDGVSSELVGITPSFAFGIGENSRMVLNAEYFTDNRTVDRGIPSYQGKPLNTQRDTFFGDADTSNASTDVASFDALYEYDFDGAVLRNHFRIANYDKFYQNVYPGVVNATGTQVSISAYNNDTDRQNIFNQTDYIFDIKQTNVTHRMLIGMELGNQDTQNYRETGYFGSPLSTSTSEMVSVDNPVPTMPIYYRQSSTDADNTGVAKIAAVYVQDQLHIGEHWQIIAGLRYDYFNMDFTDNRTGRVEQTDNTVSPRLGVIFQATKDLNLYASYSSAYVPRAGDQLSSLTLSNANLEPEQFINTEIGMKWQLSQSIFTSLALYNLDRNNVAVSGSTPGQSLLIDAQNSKGLEWEIGGNINKQLQVTAGYAYQDAEITETISSSALKGATVALVPKNSGFVWGRWDINAMWGIGLGVTSQSSVYTTTSNKVKLPGFTRVDSAIYFTQNQFIEWQLNIENMSDKYYYSSAHNDNNISIGTPRAYILSANINF